ncbi:MAG: ornithine carbamoyltransferase [Dehalococcoidia bacterium]
MQSRHLTSILDLSPEDLERVLDVALSIKRDGTGPALSGQVLALLFEKPSLRTRVSFEVAMSRLGGRSLYIGKEEVQIGSREPVRDVARVLSRMVNGVAIRTFDQAPLDEFASWSSVPVINALSDHEHPCQVLADLLTLRERFGTLRGLRLAYLGEGNNVARSLAYAAVLAGVEFVCASPAGYALTEVDIGQASELPGGGSVLQTDDAVAAVRGAAALYTDVWASMGEEHLLAERIEVFRDYQLNGELLAAAPADALVMHDLPAHRGEEITDEAIESPRSIVFDQAENRLHAQQALLMLLMGRSPQ